MPRTVEEMRAEITRMQQSTEPEAAAWDLIQQTLTSGASYTDQFAEIEVILNAVKTIRA